MKLKLIQSKDLPVGHLALADIFHKGEMTSRVIRRVDDSVVPAFPSGLKCVLFVDATAPNDKPFCYNQNNSVYVLPVEPFDQQPQGFEITDKDVSAVLSAHGIMFGPEGGDTVFGSFGVKFKPGTAKVVDWWWQ